LDILVVEDDPDLRETLQTSLREEGYSVNIAENGLAALDLLRRVGLQPRLVILDLMMPAVSGWEFHAAVRKLPEISRIPILVLSAFIDDRQATWLGVPPEDCIRKPFALETLLAAVSRLCGPPDRTEKKET
jgi:two-component system response regulator MprA